jgi:hypothetical protein
MMQFVEEYAPILGDMGHVGACKGFIMRLSKWCWQALCLAGVVVWLSLPSTSFAQDSNRQDSKKAKGAKPNVVEIDLNTLPPDLAKRLLEFYVKNSAKKDGDNKGARGKERDEDERDERDTKKPKAKSTKERDEDERGERDTKKPKAKSTKERDEDERDERDAKKPQTKREGDQPGASMAQRLADLEQRLDQLVRDLSALRKDIGKKK